MIASRSSGDYGYILLPSRYSNGRGTPYGHSPRHCVIDGVVCLAGERLSYHRQFSKFETVNVRDMDVNDDEVVVNIADNSRRQIEQAIADHRRRPHRNSSPLRKEGRESPDAPTLLVLGSV